MRSEGRVRHLGLLASGSAIALVSVACAESGSAGGRAAAPSAPLHIPPIGTIPKPRETDLVRFRPGAAAPSGCFAISRRTGGVACVVGEYVSTSSDGERRLDIIQPDSAVPERPIQVDGPSLELAPESRSFLDELMTAGEFVALDPPIVLPLGSPGVFGELHVELQSGEPTGIATVVRSANAVALAGAQDPHAGLIFRDTLSDVVCTAPSLSVRILEPARVLIERVCRIPGDAVIASAWICDSERATCD